MRYAIVILILFGAVYAEEEPRRKGKKRGHDMERLEKVIRSINAGIEGLKMIDRHEEAQHLAGIVRELKQKMGGNKEVKVARKQLEILRMAFHACQEAEKRKWAEMLEHAIHARELRLEGRRDKEAVHVYESQPSLGNVAELLMASAGLWKEFGNRDKADLCMKLGKQFAAKLRKKQPKREREARREPRERERERGEGRERERRHRESDEQAHAREQQQELLHALRNALERVEKLEKRLAGIEARLERANRDR